MKIENLKIKYVFVDLKQKLIEVIVGWVAHRN